jgi:hypothetical protein
VWGLGQRPNVKVFVHLFQKVVGERSEGKALLQKKKVIRLFSFFFACMKEVAAATSSLYSFSDSKHRMYICTFGKFSIPVLNEQGEFCLLGASP